MAAFKIGWNEGSLLRRTVLHVLAFVGGSAVFIAVVSLLLVSVAKRVLPSRDGSSDETASEDGGGKSEKDKGEKTASPNVPKLGPKGIGRLKRPRSAGAGADEGRAKDKDKED